MMNRLYIVRYFEYNSSKANTIFISANNVSECEYKMNGSGLIAKDSVDSGHIDKIEQIGYVIV